MNLKSVLMLCGAVLFCGGLFTTANAEPNKPARKAPRVAHDQGRRMGYEQRGIGRIDELAKQLDLKEDQKKRIYPYLEGMKTRSQEILTDPNLGPEEKREKMRELRTTTDESIAKVLTPEQRVKFEELKKNEAARPGRPGELGGGMQRMLGQLNLTEDQKAKLRPIMEGQREKVKAVMEDKSLSPEQRREKLRAIGEEIMPQVEPILTPEQKTKLEELKKDMQNRMPRREGRRPRPADSNQ